MFEYLTLVAAPLVVVRG